MRELPQPGDRVRMTASMPDHPAITKGATGTVVFVGTSGEVSGEIHVQWDDGLDRFLLAGDPFVIDSRRGEADRGRA